MPVGISIPKTRGKAKIKIIEKRKMTQEMLKQLETDDLDVSLALIQALIPYGLKAVEDKLKAEFELLTGKRYQHGKENLRWGKQGGSVYLRDQKLPIMVPRIRNKRLNQEVSLETYEKLQEPYLSDRETMLKLLNGISMRKYQECAELVPQVFGLSASNLSRRFKEKTAEMLQRLKTRNLSRYDFICIFINGKRYAKDGLLIALGVTVEGKKVILDIAQSYSESTVVISEFMDKLIERGLKFEDSFLFVVDGSKGIIRAIENKFEEHAFIQRCLWHKQQNVTSYLNDSQKQICKRRLKEAYEKTTYLEAKRALENLQRELKEVNLSAANSLLEGLEETVTLHRLGLSLELCKSLNSTNCIEPVMAQLG